MVSTYQCLINDTCYSCAADIFQNKQELESRFVLVFILWIKKFNFKWIYMLNFEEFNGVFDREELVIWLTVLKKVSWFLNFFDLITFADMASYKSLTTCVYSVWKLCLYLCCTFSKCHRLFSCFGGAWAFLARNFVRSSFACDILEMKHEYKYF